MKPSNTNINKSGEDQHAAVCQKSNWARSRIKYLLREMDKRTESGTEPLLSMRQTKGLILHNEVSNKRIKNEELVGYKIIRSGQLVMNRMRASIGLFAASSSHGLVSPDYAVFQPIRPVNLDYLVRLFQTSAMKSIFRQESKGMGTGSSGFLRLYTDRFGAISIFLPPLAEQNHIIGVVKAFEKKIARFIRNKRRLIGLLKEQKQNIINRAVTRGLDPNVKLKPSGVEWLGDIPEHWETAPLKHLAKINNNVLYDSTDKNYTFKYLDISSVDTGFLVREPEIIRFGQAPSRARRILKKGDTIISTVRTYLKAVYHVATEIQDWIASTGFAVLTPNNTIYPSFLGLLIVSDCFINRVIQKSVGVAYPAISETQLGTLYLAYPASIDEQRKIWEAVSLSSKFLDQAISRAEREIELMTEYRARLISDVVTGKVDVRGIDVPQISEDELPTPDDEADVEDELLEEEMPEEEIEDADE